MSEEDRIMDCVAARRALDETAGPAGLSGEFGAAHQHMRSCAQCREWLAAGQEWRRALRDSLLRIEAPLPVRERLIAALARARAGVDLRIQRRRFVAAVVFLAVAGAGLAGLLWWRESTRDDLLVQALAEDHLLYATNPAPAEFASQDSVAVARWFADRVDFAVPAPALSEGELIGGRLCTLVDRRVALWIYRTGDRRVSLFQMTTGGLALGHLRPMTVGSKRLLCGHSKGLSVLTWTERGLLYALVSDLPETALLRLIPS